MIKKVLSIVLAILLFSIPFLLVSLWSTLYHNEVRRVNVTGCNSSYRNVTVCEFENTIEAEGFYLDGRVYVRNDSLFKSLDLKHEYCHYVQEVNENKRVGFWEELECYLVQFQLVKQKEVK